MIGIAGSHVAVSQDRTATTLSGGVVGSLAGVVALGPLNAMVRGNLYLGGGGGGLEGIVSEQAYLGLGIPIGSALQVFGGAGVGVRGIKNDELAALAIDFPAATAGFLIATDYFSFVAAPTAGLAGRTEYAPGDELQGRRFFRRASTQLGYGGVAGLFTDYFSVHGSLQQLAMTHPITSADGVACIHVSLVAVCGFGQYWTGLTANPAGVERTIASTQIGLSLGLGKAAAGALAL